MLSAPASVGISKSGAAVKVNAPVSASMLNFPASAPPAMVNVRGCAGRSASDAVTVVTVVPFSATLTAAVTPAPLLVIEGATLPGASTTSVTETAMACVSVSAPSLTCTITS